MPLTNGEVQRVRNKDYKQRRAAQLKMPYGTATNKLRLKVIFDLLREFSRCLCCRCGILIDAPENLSVVHLEPWMDESPRLFWRTDNIAFSHRSCDAARQEKNMSIIEVDVLNEQGEKLNTYSQNGKIWIAGHKGQRYDIRIRNKSSDRIEAVCTVDGRDVVSGELGDFSGQSGYVINPYDSYTIKGFRQNNDRVAAFRFSGPGESYSSKKGTPQNIGIMGVAVFREKRPEFSWGAGVRSGSLSSGGQYDLVGCGYSKPRDLRHNPMSVDIDYHIPTRGGGAGGGTYSAAGPTSNDGDSLTIPSFESGFSMDAGAACVSPDAVNHIDITHTSHTTILPSRRDVARGSQKRTRRYKTSVKLKSELGTEYGESVNSSVHTVSFTREDVDNPNEVHIVRYDSVRGLERRGIDVSQPLGTVEPEAFPGAYVAPGFAQPPPK